MGTADVKEVLKGDTFGGVLAEPLPVRVAWDRSNHWIVDTSDEQYADIPDEVWEYLILNDNFSDVTDYVRVPLNEHQKMFLGMRDGDQKTEAELAEDRQKALDEAFEAARNAAAAANAREEVLAKIRNSDATREELLTVAKDHNIKGRSKMTREELQEALTDAVRNSTPVSDTNVPTHGTAASSGTAATGTMVGGSTAKGGTT